MPRFERIEDRRFWEIHVDADGRTVHSRAGLLGSDGRPSARKTWPTKKAAAAELKARITEQLGKGYVKCPEWDEPATPQLLAGIAANPAVADGYLVYADWLQQKRHPRGELIALQSARGASGDKKLLAAEAALLEKYPKLAPPRCTDAARKVRKKHPDFATTVLRWENGFIASARLAHFFSEQNFTIRELLVELLEHPAGRFLRRLELGIRGDVNGVVSYVDALAELARLGREPELYWGECEGSELYAVTFRPGSMEGTCSCPGNLYRGGACKHVVALAMLATSGHAFKALARPNGFG